MEGTGGKKARKVTGEGVYQVEEIASAKVLRLHSVF
jgi:hypothetical protein